MCSNYYDVVSTGNLTLLNVKASFNSYHFVVNSVSFSFPKYKYSKSKDQSAFEF